MKDSSSLLRVLHTLIKECAAQCSTDASRDVQRINERFRHEGMSFLTITLPDFCQDFFQGLEEGWVTSDLFRGWKKRLCLPAFMQGFTSLCFDARTGRRFDEPHIHAIRSVRQVGLFLKKIKLDCTEERTAKALNQYIQTDSELFGITSSVPRVLLEEYRRVARMVTGTVFHDVIDLDEIVPHHGPGSTAEKCTGNDKYRFLCAFHDRLRPWFDESIFFNSEESFYLSGVEIPVLSEAEESPVRVTTVPKTQKSPRIIAMEPVIMQMVQQGLKDYVVRRIETSPITGGHVNFKDQSVNRTLAQRASRSLSNATLDLSEASDRVSNDLVKILFEVNGELNDMIQSCRSTHALLPNGQKLKLNKFASMGSALCFPVEALFFFVLLILNGLRHSALPPTLRNILHVSKRYYVYGDDIICPVDEVESIFTLFATFGCKVSKTKSFFKGSFRESCGMDAYGGVDITPVYMRNSIPSRRRDVGALVSCVATANQLHSIGFTETALSLKDSVELVLGKLPSVESTCAGIGWSFGEYVSKRRTSPNYQRLEVQTFSVVPLKKEDTIDGYSALSKTMLLGRIPKKDGDEPLDSQLERTVRRGALTLKRRWVTPY